MIFTDTSAFYALAYPDDQNHVEAKRRLNAWMEENIPLVTHNYILLETFALMQRRLGIEVVRKFYKDAQQFCRTLWVSQTHHERAAKRYVGQDGSRYSFVDCVSFEMMRTHGIHKYFAFDDDFRRAGFEPA